jgi:hypothetical protein
MTEEKPDILDLLREWHDVDPERAATLFQAIEEIAELRRQLQEDTDFFDYFKRWIKGKLNVR